MTDVAAVVFDLDGTLFDHQAAARAGLDEWLAGMSIPVTDELVRAWFDAEDRHFLAWRDGHVTIVEQRRGRMRDVLPLMGIGVGPDEDLDGRFAGYLGAYQRAWRGFDDADDALRLVQRLGVVTAVLTNGSEEQQRAKLAHLGLLERVGPVFTAEALGVAKPRTRAFHLVCERLGLAPPQVLYVGDEHEVDVLGARAAGLRAVHLDRHGAGPHDEPDRVTGLAGLADVVARLAGASSER